MGETPGKCCDCKGHCNSKGYPSVMKGSKYCEQQRGVITQVRQGIWAKMQRNKVITSFMKHYRKARGR